MIKSRLFEVNKFFCALSNVVGSKFHALMFVDTLNILKISILLFYTLSDVW